VAFKGLEGVGLQEGIRLKPQRRSDWGTVNAMQAG